MNNTFRLFVSSTFSDFIKERAILNKEIFEKINLLLNKKGYSFQVVDLRWGINTESALNQNTLEICLNDVKYCKNNSPKPNFLIMIGERYGWVPLPSHVERGEFEKILAVCNDEQRAMLLKWYLVDTNSIPEVYYLNKRSGEYVNEEVWHKEEECLHSILEAKAVECGFDESELIKYTASATEHEILEGLLENDDAADNVLVLFREGDTERDRDLSKINDLKRRIKEKIDKESLSDNLVTLECGENYYREMEQRITELLVKNITEELERLEAEKESYVPEKLTNEVFCGRESELEALKTYIDGKDNGVYYLSGQSGSGKTTLLKEFVCRCNEFDPEKQFDAEYEVARENKSLKEAWQVVKRYASAKKMDTFCVFFGEDDVYSIYDCLKRLCRMMADKYNIALNSEINKFNASETLLKVMGATPRSVKTVIVIDGLDMFYDIESVSENIFPDTLYDGVKIIVSCANNKIIEKLKKRNDTEYCISGFSCDDAVEGFYKMLEARGRMLSNDGQRAFVSQALSEGANPLSCKLLCDLAVRWHGNDDIIPFEFDDYEMARLHIFDAFEGCGHNESIVRYALSYIASAPFGVTEDELLMLLFKHPEIKSDFAREDRYHYDLSKLPYAVLSRILYDLKECIHLSKSKDSIILSFNHNIFKTVVMNEFKAECATASERLLEYYASLDNYISDDKYPNTKKLAPLLRMLDERQRYNDISAALSDFTFADAMIKSGGLSELCECYDKLEEKGLLSEYGKALFACIQNNMSTLGYYRNGLEDCARHNGLTDGEPIIELSDGANDENESAAYSKTYWSCNGERYAVAHGNYVYIYKKDSHRNYLSVYINFSNYFGDEKISEIIWTRDDKFAVVLNVGKIFIYKTEDNMPKFEAELKCSDNCKTVKYSHKLHLLLFPRGRMLVAVDMSSYEERYCISGSGTGIFDINNTTERLVVLANNSKMKLYALCDGTFINDVPTHQGLTDDVERIYLLENGTVIGIVEGYPINIKLLSTTKATYLFFPEIYEINDCFKIGNSFVVCYDNLLINANMSDYGLSYLSVPNIKNVYADHSGTHLYVTTGSGVRCIECGDFVPLDEKLYLSNKTLELHLASTSYGLSETFKKSMTIEKRRYNVKSFYMLFGRDISFSDNEIGEYVKKSREYFDTVTFMAHSNDGHVMIAKEGENRIMVLDKSGKTIYRLGKMKLSVDNVIIDSRFSDDSRYLYILKTDGIVLIDIQRRKRICAFDFDGIPPRKVEFASDGRVAFTLEERHELPLCRGLERQYRKIAVKKYTEADFESFDIPCLSGAYIAEKFLTEIIRTNDITHGYKNAYHVCGAKLAFENGAFFVDGKRVENAFCDFSSALKYELNKEQSRFASLIKMKNDITSRLIKKDDKLVLVSIALNSIVIFDTARLEVVSAKKIDGKILGVRELPDGIELHTDSYPYKSRAKFHI